MKKITFLIFLSMLIVIGVNFMFSCTVGVASGKATLDGRPLLWKNRDSSGFENYVQYFISNGYNFLGLFSRGIPSSMYGGMNERGFAIMNSVAYDKGKTGGFDNGRLMKRALEECGSVSEFELLLKKVMGKYDLAANFGVIDSQGRAVIYETSSNSYEKYDAAKTKDGYILRTNFSISGGGKVGIRRFVREKEIFEKKLSNKKLTVNFLLKKVFRDIKDESGTIFNYDKGYSAGDKRFYNTKNSICRPYSVSGMVFRGVKPDEPEYLSTFYIILGNPLTGSVLPLWVAAGDVPEIVGRYKNSLLNFEQMKIYHYIYPHDKEYTLDVSYLAGERSPNLIRKLFSLENSIIGESEQALKSWRKSFPGEKAISAFQNYLAEKLYSNYRKINKELYYLNKFRNINIKPALKINKNIISNILSDGKKLYFISSDNRLNIFNTGNRKIKRIKLGFKTGKHLLMEKGFDNTLLLLQENKLIKITPPLYKKMKIIGLSDFHGYDRYLKNNKTSFFIRVRNNLLVGVPEKHIIINIDISKKRITKKAGKYGFSGFRDGTSSLSLLKTPYSAFKNNKDELIFSDKGNNSIRCLTQAGVVFTIVGKGRRGVESGWKHEVQIDEPMQIIENEEGDIFLITNIGLRIIDKEYFSFLLIKNNKFKNYNLVYLNGKIHIYDNLKKILERLNM